MRAPILASRFFMSDSAKPTNPNKFNKNIGSIGGFIRSNYSESREVIVFLGDVARATTRLIFNPSRMRWNDLFYYMNLCGSQALPIVAMICLLMGLIMGFQGAVLLRTYGAELYIADLVGFTILKEMGPLMVAMISTGRAGSAFAAEIGTMKINEEINALSTMGIEPVRMLVVPKLLAMIVVIPLLTVFGDICGVFGGFIVGTGLMGIPMAAYYERTVRVLTLSAFNIGIIKSVVFAIIIALVGCYRGFQSSADAQGVGRATTSSVVISIFIIVVADAVMTVLCYVLGY